MVINVTMPNHVRLLKSRVPGRRLIWGAREKELGSREKIKNDDSQQRFLAQHSVAMLEQCCNHSKQCRNDVATLCCSKNRRRESSRVKSPLRQSQLCENIHCAKHNSLQVHLALPGAVNRFWTNKRWVWFHSWELKKVAPNFMANPKAL